MFAIAFDLTVAEVQVRHPKGVSQAYIDIASTLERYGFKRVQGSVYVCDSEDLANLSRQCRHCTRSSGSRDVFVTSARSGSSSGPTSQATSGRPDSKLIPAS